MNQIEYIFNDFDLAIEPERVRLLASPAGTSTEEGEIQNDQFQLPIKLDLAKIEELVMKTADEADSRRQTSRSEDWVRASRKELQAFGQALFEQLFPANSPLLYNYLRSFMPPGASTPDRLIRLRLRFRLSPQLAHIPWEILHASRYVVGGELALSASVARLPVTKRNPAAPAVVEPPLNVLLVADSPYAADQQRLAEQEQLIRDSLTTLEQEGLVRVLRLAPLPHENSSLQSLARTLENEEVHVLHFMGHGYYDINQTEPVGYLEMTRGGQAYDYTGLEVATALEVGVQRQLRLVVLNACEGARSRPSQKSLQFSGVAQALLDVGLPAVLAMQYEISDPAAKALAVNFYRRLIETGSVDEAVRHSRYHLLNTITETLEWVTPVLFLTGTGQPFASIRRPLAVDSLLHVRRVTVPHRFESYILEKSRGFVGREYVFAAIDAFISRQQKGYFEIEGDPGVGKSAILSEFVRRTGAISHFNIRSQSVNTSRQFLESLHAQLEQRYELPPASLPVYESDYGSFLATRLEQAAAKLSPGERLLIAIDALDEVDDPTGQPNSSTNILYLPRVLPDQVFVVMTRRPFPHTFRVDEPYEVLDLMQYQDESDQDIQVYIWRAVDNSQRLQAWIDSRPGRLSRAAFTIELTKLSDRNFMYLHYVLPAIERGDYVNLNIEALPQGLQGYYEDHWQRMRAEYGPEWETRIKIVYILSEVKQPVSLQLISDFAKVRPLLVQKVLREWDEFLREEQIEGHTRYSVYHASFRDFLHRRDIVQAAGLELQEIHSMIADDLWEELYGPEE